MERFPWFGDEQRHCVESKENLVFVASQWGLHTLVFVEVLQRGRASGERLVESVSVKRQSSHRRCIASFLTDGTHTKKFFGCHG